MTNSVLRESELQKGCH